MTQWTENNRKAFSESGLLEPKTKAAKLRARLAEFELSRSYGHTLAGIRAFLEEQGLAFPSYKAFQKAYWSARKAGPLAAGAAFVAASAAESGKVASRGSPASLPPVERLPGKPVWLFLPNASKR